MGRRELADDWNKHGQLAGEKLVMKIEDVALISDAPTHADGTCVSRALSLPFFLLRFRPPLLAVLLSLLHAFLFFCRPFRFCCCAILPFFCVGYFFSSLLWSLVGQSSLGITCLA